MKSLKKQVLIILCLFSVGNSQTTVRIRTLYADTARSLTPSQEFFIDDTTLSRMFHVLGATKDSSVSALGIHGRGMLIDAGASINTLTLTNALGIASGGTNNTLFNSGKLVKFDGTRLISTGIDTSAITTLGSMAYADSTKYHGSASITTLGTIGTGTWQAMPVITTYGGTGLNSFTAGDILYYNTGTTLSKLAANSTATKKYLQSVSSGNPSWQQVALSDLSGVGTMAFADSALWKTAASGTFLRDSLYIRNGLNVVKTLNVGTNASIGGTLGAGATTITSTGTGLTVIQSAAGDYSRILQKGGDTFRGGILTMQASDATETFSLASNTISSFFNSQGVPNLTMTGANSQFSGTLGVTGAINGQTISSIANFTGTVNVASTFTGRGGVYSTPDGTISNVSSAWLGAQWTAITDKGLSISAPASQSGRLIEARIGTTDKFVVDAAGTATLANDLAVNGSNLTSTTATFNLFPSGVTTLNIGGATTTATLFASGNRFIADQLNGRPRFTWGTSPGTGVSGRMYLPDSLYSLTTQWMNASRDLFNIGTVSVGGNILLNGHYLSNDGGNEGISIADNGDVTIPANLTITGRVGAKEFAENTGNMTTTVSNYNLVTAAAVALGDRVGINTAPATGVRHHIYEETNGNEIQRMEVVKGSGISANPYEQEFFFSDTTNSATPKTILSFGTTQDENYLIETRSTWRSSDDVVYGAGVYMSTWSNLAGTAALVGTVTTVHQQIAGSSIPSHIASGANVNISLTGTASKTIYWSTIVMIFRVKQ